MTASPADPGVVPAVDAGAAFTALAWESSTPLPAAALEALTGFAMSAPDDRVQLRSALLRRPELPAELVTRLLGDPEAERRRLAVRVSWLLRPEHTEADLDAAFAQTSDLRQVLRVLAADAAASPLLLGVIASWQVPAGDADGGVATALLINPNTPDDARLITVECLDALVRRKVRPGIDAAHDADWLTNMGLSHVLSAVERGVPEHLGATAVQALTVPVLLAPLARWPLPVAAQQRIVDVCVVAPLAAGVRNDALFATVLTGLAGDGSRAVRQRAVDALVAAGVDRLNSTDVAVLAGLTAAVGGVSESTDWPAAATAADDDAAAAARLGQLLTAGLGEDAGAWRALTALAAGFPGTVAELVTACRGVAARP